MGVRRGPQLARSGSREPAPDAGMVTAEAAVVLPVVVLVALLATAGVQVAVAQTRCLEAAAVASRLAARGESGAAVADVVRAGAPAGARSRIDILGDVTRATVSVALRVPVVGAFLPAFQVQERAVAVTETDGSG